MKRNDFECKMYRRDIVRAVESVNERLTSGYVCLAYSKLGILDHSISIAYRNNAITEIELCLLRRKFWKLSHKIDDVHFEKYGGII